LRISQKGIDFIKGFEKLKLQTYLCEAGVPTIGYGHTGKDVMPGMTITSDMAEVLLRKDLAWAESAVNELVSHVLRQCMFDALVSLVFNIGRTNFAKSTLLKYLNQRAYLECSNQFLVWRRANGRVSAGLTRRRELEREMFLFEGIT
jgi:lysozyme